MGVHLASPAADHEHVQGKAVHGVEGMRLCDVEAEVTLATAGSTSQVTTRIVKLIKYERSVLEHNLTGLSTPQTKVPR